MPFFDPFFWVTGTSPPLRVPPNLAGWVSAGFQPTPIHLKSTVTDDLSLRPPEASYMAFQLVPEHHRSGRFHVECGHRFHPDKVDSFTPVSVFRTGFTLRLLFGEMGWFPSPSFRNCALVFCVNTTHTPHIVCPSLSRWPSRVCLDLVPPWKWPLSLVGFFWWQYTLVKSLDPRSSLTEFGPLLKWTLGLFGRTWPGLATREEERFRSSFSIQPGILCVPTLISAFLLLFDILWLPRDTSFWIVWNRLFLKVPPFAYHSR